MLRRFKRRQLQRRGSDGLETSIRAPSPGEEDRDEGELYFRVHPSKIACSNTHSFPHFFVYAAKELALASQALITGRGWSWRDGGNFGRRLVLLLEQILNFARREVATERFV